MSSRKKAVILILRILAALSAVGLCWPVSLFFNELLGDGETTLQSMSRAVLCSLLVLLTVLAVTAGVRGMAGRPVRLTVTLICLTMAACVAVGTFSVRTEESTGALGNGAVTVSTPRPTVTPPPVEIKTVETVNTNPESGTVFYKKYADNSVSLTVDNASTRDLFIRIRTRDAMTVLEFYVRANDTVTVNAPVGTYEYVCAVGRHWEDEETCFGEDTVYKKGKEYAVYPLNGEHEISFTKGLTGLLDISANEFNR